jgi:hypothetical protein
MALESLCGFSSPWGSGGGLFSKFGALGADEDDIDAHTPNMKDGNHMNLLLPPPGIHVIKQTIKSIHFKKLYGCIFVDSRVG